MTQHSSLAYYVKVPISEKDRLSILEQHNSMGIEGQCLLIPGLDALERIKVDPLQQLPGEGDQWYERFLHYVHSNAGTIVGWHRQYHRKEWKESRTSWMASMFLWRKRGIQHNLNILEQKEIAARKVIFDSQVIQLELNTEYVRKLIAAALVEESPQKAQAMFKTARELQSNTLRNQSENRAHDTRREVELQKLVAGAKQEQEDLD